MIKPKYSFFNLFINGESQGLYAFEEKMGKEVVERNQRRSGPIFSKKMNITLHQNQIQFFKSTMKSIGIKTKI